MADTDTIHIRNPSTTIADGAEDIWCAAQGVDRQHLFAHKPLFEPDHFRVVAERLVPKPGAEHKRWCGKVVDDKSSVEYLVGA